MHQKRNEIVAIEIKSEENAETHVVDAGLHGAVVRLRVIAIVGLRSLRVQLFVGRLVICFLEELIGTDLGVVQLLVVFYGRCRDVDVDAADGAVLVLDRINRLDGVKDVFDRVVLRVFARFEKQTLVTEVLQCNHFTLDFLHRELLAHDVLVLGVIRAVCAAVDAVVGEVERRKKHDALAVDVFLHLNGGVENALSDFRIIVGKQHSRFAVSKPLEGHHLVEQLINQGCVILVFFTVGQRSKNFLVVDELFCARRARIVRDAHGCDS